MLRKAVPRSIVGLAILVATPLRTISLVHDTEEPRVFDVVVYGGTAGGAIAAVSAAREGLSVALLEPRLHVGGMVSGGLSATDYGREEVIGGYALEYFRRVGRHYNEAVTWNFEPSVAEATFREMLREAGVHVFLQHRLRAKTSVIKRDARIATIALENGATFSGRVFIDASYEGDLMAMAGVSYTWGREGASEFGESLAGVREHTPKHQFLVRVSPYDETGKLLPEVSALPKGEPGAADRKVQAYNFRVCMTDRSDNRVPFPRPERFDARRYELLARYLAEIDKLKPATIRDTVPIPPHADPIERLRRPWTLADVMQPRPTKNGKYDTNNNGAFSTDYIGGSRDYPDGDYQTRDRIWQEHVRYVQGFFYFLANDPRVPRGLQADLAQWGLCKDEFTDDGNWPHQLYIREARRMRGDFVMSQRDIQTDLKKQDVIGMGSYQSDSHNVQRVATPDGGVENEGDGQVAVLPYEIPYRLMLPKRDQVTNLLVSVAFSATHVAYSTLRMEPQYMIIGHAAGVAAKMAIDAQSPVQDIDTRTLTAQLRSQGAVMEWVPRP